MTDLPPGWARAKLGDLLLRIEAGKSFTCEPRPAEDDEWGIVKVSAMTWGTFRESENKAVPAYREINPAYEIRPGDILVSRANTEEYVGAPVLVGDCRPRLLLSDKSLRLVPSSELNRSWLLHVLKSPTVRKAISARATGTKDSMRNISQQALSEIEVLVPPADEQQRTAEDLESYLSCLGLTDERIELSMQKLQLLKKRILVEAVPIPGPAHWKMATVNEVGQVDLGRQRHPDWHSGPHMRSYLRVANVFEARIDTGDLMEMDFPPAVFEKFRLTQGDILLNEGQSPEYLGRPAMYRGEPKEVAFTNSLLRFRAGPEVDPEWALLVFRRHMHAGRFMQETRITTNIAHLSASRFKSVEFPVPPLDEQREIVKRVTKRLAEVDLLSVQINHAREKSAALRNRLLTDAYSGRLVSQDPIHEPATELLKRIQAEREAIRAKRQPLRETAATRQRPSVLPAADVRNGSRASARILSVPSPTVGVSRTGNQEVLFQEEELSS
ncbi:restriction endonuclease subunit S [Microtetraspora glauca]|uniref:Restriction endonuclease subunit S n=1 Tax=Microtetraspora glauca TaxID=1996 RepID=A0ABV3GS97_MICGL